MQNFFLHREKPKEQVTIRAKYFWFLSSHKYRQNKLVSDMGFLEAAVKMGHRIVVYLCFLNCPHGIISDLLIAARM